MPKRVLCIAVTMILALTFGVSISALSQDNGQFNNDQTESAIAENLNTTLIFVISIGNRTEDAQIQDTARFLLKPMLHSYEGTETTVKFFPVKRDGKLSEPFDLSQEEAMRECSRALDGESLKLYASGSAQEQSEAYFAFSMELEKEMENNQGKVEVWFIESRKIQNVMVSKNAIAKTAEKLNELAKNNPKLEMHFAYLNDELYQEDLNQNEAAEAERSLLTAEKAEALRIDEYLTETLMAEGGIEEAGRVHTHLLAAGDFFQESATGENSIPALVREKYRAALQEKEEIVQATSEGNTIRLRVQRDALKEQGDALKGQGDALVLLKLPQEAPKMLTHEAALPAIHFVTVDQPTLEEAGEVAQEGVGEPLPAATPTEEADNGEATLLYAGERRAWFLLRDCPAGAYDIILSFAKNENDSAEWISSTRLDAYGLVKESKVWLQAEKSAGEAALMDRDDLPFSIFTDATDVPVERWHVRLLKNGQPLENVGMTHSEAEKEAGVYQWSVVVPKALLDMGPVEFSAEVFLTDPDQLLIKSENVISEELGNRDPKPIATVAEKISFFDLPEGRGADAEIKIDLAELFHDPDGDELTYRVQGMENAPMVATEYYQMRQEGAVLYYQPIKEHDLPVEISITCRDRYGAESAPCKLVVQQYSVKALLESLRAHPAMGGDADAEKATVFFSEGEWRGKLQQELPLRFELKEEDATSPLGLFVAAQNQFPQELPPLEEALQISVRAEVSQDQQFDPPLTIEKGEAAWLIRGELPAQEDNALYTLTFTADYLGVELPGLLDSFCIRVENTAPFLRQTEGEKQWRGDIQGPPFQREEVALSAILGLEEGQPIRLDEYFDDVETAQTLRYGIVVEEGANYRIVQGDKELLLNEDGEYAPQINEQDGSCAIDVLFEDAGRFSMKVYARDGVYESPAMGLSVEIESAFSRMVWQIALMMVSAILLIVAALALKYHFKPSFQGVFVKVVSREGGSAEVTTAMDSAKGMWLDYYHKGRVSLLELLTTLEQPPLTSIPTTCLSDIYLSPAKKAHGIVRISCGKQAEQCQIMLGNQQRLTAKRPIHITMNITTVYAAQNNEQEHICIRIANDQDPFSFSGTDI